MTYPAPTICKDLSWLSPDTAVLFVPSCILSMVQSVSLASAPDTVYRSLCMAPLPDLQEFYNSTLSILFYLVSCGAPTPPGNGSIGAHQNISEGTEILFGCNQGFFPIGQRTAVCQTTGNWFPDPADLVCTSELFTAMG